MMTKKVPQVNRPITVTVRMEETFRMAPTCDTDDSLQRVKRTVPQRRQQQRTRQKLKRMNQMKMYHQKANE